MNDKPNIFQKFWYFLTFRTYGNHLLISHSANFLLSCAVVIFIVVTAEALAWGYFGSTFTPDNPYLGGGIVGGLIFFIFYFFDRIVITQDMLSEEHSHTLNGERYKPNFWQKYKNVFSLGGRMLIAIASLWLTAPYLTQIVFKSDIENQKELQYKAMIEQAKTDALGKIEQNILSQQNYIKGLHDKLQSEIGGKRGSKYGKGPVSQSIQAELDHANNELNSLKQNLEQTKNSLENAIIHNDIQTLKNFGITVMKDSPIFRENAIKILEKEPAFVKTQNTVKGVLVIFVIILIMMKLAQPKSLQLYYSARLQEAWSNYRKGNYDDYLPESEKSIYMSDVIMPQTFERIVINYSYTKEERERDDRLKKEQEKLSEAKERLKKERLKDSEIAHAYREAHEAQKYVFEQKVLAEKKQRIENALAEAKLKKQQFEMEYLPRKELLIQQEKEIEEELFEAERFYQSQNEDRNAREKRLNEAKNKLDELKNITIDLESRENLTPERVRTYNIAQEAVLNQNNAIKNMRDNYLSFERDMNIHKEKVDKLRGEKNRVSNEIKSLQDLEEKITQNILILEQEKMELLTEFAHGETPYIQGDESEIDFIAEQHRLHGAYKFHRFTPYKKGDEE